MRTDEQINMAICAPPYCPTGPCTYIPGPVLSPGWVQRPSEPEREIGRAVWAPSPVPGRGGVEARATPDGRTAVVVGLPLPRQYESGMSAHVSLW